MDVLDVMPGDEVVVNVPYTISHPGPMLGWLAKAPEGGVRGWVGEGRWAFLRDFGGAV